MEYTCFFNGEVRMSTLLASSQLRIRLVKGLFYGQIVGFIYFISTLVFFWPEEEIFLIKNTVSRVHFFLYSLAFWAIGFSLLMIILFLITGLAIRKKSGFITRFFATTTVLFVALMGYGAYYHYEYKISPNYPFYLLKSDMVKVFLTVIIVSILGGLLVSGVLGLRRRTLNAHQDEAKRIPKFQKISVISFSFLFLYFLTTSLSNQLSLPKEKNTTNPIIKNIYVLGIDGAAWNTLVPLLKENALPNLTNMLENSSYGHFDTYGKQSTPQVWTSIATGKIPEKHNIYNFEDMIYDWRAKPVWEIIGDKGDKVGVVNWMNAFPAEEINGFLVANNQVDSPRVFSIKHPEDFDLPPEPLYPQREVILGENTLETIMLRFENELEDSQKILKRCHNLHSYRAIFAYLYYIDAMQHFYWQAFSEGKDILPASSSNHSIQGQHVFYYGWKRIDELIGDILKKVSGDTLFCIMSDHGSRLINKIEMVVNTNKILDILGYASLDGQLENRSFPTVINDELIETSREMSNKEFSQLVAELKGIRFWPSKKPIFREVRIFDRKDKRLINMRLTRPLKVRPKKIQSIKIGKNIYDYDDIVEPHPWSGRHRARGMIVMSGPFIKKKKFLGAWLIDSPYFFFFRLLHGRVRILDKVYPALKFFHLADPITTLDVTPTLLNMLGYAAASDMDGKDFSPLVGMHALGKPVDPIASYGSSQHYDEQKAKDEKVSEKIREEMRALGYIE